MTSFTFRQIQDIRNNWWLPGERELLLRNNRLISLKAIDVLLPENSMIGSTPVHPLGETLVGI